MTFLCLISTVCGEKQAEGRGCHSQASPQPNRLCRQCWPWGAAGTSLPGHTGRDMQGLHAWTRLLPAQAPTGPWAKAATPISPTFFFFFFGWVRKAEQREAPGPAETTAHALLNLVSLLPQGNIPQSRRLLPAYPCTLSVCRHAQTADGPGRGASFCSVHTQRLLGAVPPAGYCLLRSCRQKLGLVQPKYKWKDARVREGEGEKRGRAPQQQNKA